MKHTKYIVHIQSFSEHTYFGMIRTGYFLDFNFDKRGNIMEIEESLNFFRASDDSKNIQFDNLNKLLRFVKASGETLI